MQLTQSPKLSLLFALSILSPLVAANSCDVNVRWTNHYDIRASRVDDIPGKCGGLWDNLKRFGECASASETYCNGKDGDLIWQFTTVSGCNKGMIESTWWEATKNDFGAISCVVHDS